MMDDPGVYVSDGVSISRSRMLEILKSSVKYLEECDDAGSFDFEIGRLQELFDRMNPIFDENGGI